MLGPKRRRFVKFIQGKIKFEQNVLNPKIKQGENIKTFHQKLQESNHIV